jgi:hypothetical protein
MRQARNRLIANNCSTSGAALGVHYLLRRLKFRENALRFWLGSPKIPPFPSMNVPERHETRHNHDARPRNIFKQRGKGVCKCMSLRPSRFEENHCLYRRKWVLRNGSLMVDTQGDLIKEARIHKSTSQRICNYLGLPDAGFFEIMSFRSSFAVMAPVWTVNCRSWEIYRSLGKDGGRMLEAAWTQ